MRKLVMTAGLIFSLVLLTFGCSSGQIDQFNKHIANIGKQINKINKQQEKAIKITGKVKYSSSESQNKQMGKEVDKALKLVDQSTDDLNIAIQEAQKAKKLDVGDNAKKYIAKIEKSFQSRLKCFKQMKKGLALFKKAFVESGSSAQVESFISLSEKSLSLLNKAAELETKAETEYSEAQVFYKQIK